MSRKLISVSPILLAIVIAGVIFGIQRFHSDNKGHHTSQSSSANISNPCTFIYVETTAGKAVSCKELQNNTASIKGNEQTLTSNSGNVGENITNTSNNSGINKTLKPYVASVCTFSVIPYQTEYEYVSFLDTGQTQVGLSGYNGTKKTCTPDSNGLKLGEYTSPPFNRVVYIGTRVPTQPTPIGPTYTYGQALSLAQQNCSVILGNLGAGNSSAMSQCVTAYLRKYGY